MSQVDQLESAPSVSTDTSYRMPRVNLLPPEIEAARRLRRTKAGLAGGLVVVVAALGGVYVTQLQARADAEEKLTNVQAQTVQLKNEQRRYADVPTTIAAIDAAETARQDAMAKDVEWYRTLTDFSLTVPENVWFKTLTVGVTPAGAAPTTPSTAAAAAAPVTDPGLGVLKLTGTAMDHKDVATWLDVLGRQRGMTYAYFTNSTKAKIGRKSVVDFTSTARITDEALSHRYDRKQG